MARARHPAVDDAARGRVDGPVPQARFSPNAGPRAPARASRSNIAPCVNTSVLIIVVEYERATRASTGSTRSGRRPLPVRTALTTLNRARSLWFRVAGWLPALAAGAKAAQAKTAHAAARMGVGTCNRAGGCRTRRTPASPFWGIGPGHVGQRPANLPASRLETVRARRQAVEIVFDHVTKRYPGRDAPAVDDLSLRSRPARSAASSGRRAAARRPR